MKYKISLCISALCFFTAFLILMASRTTGEEALASRIAPEILRFHVLAESDSARDQNLKLGVKGLVLDYIHGQVPEDADKEQLEQWIEGNKTSIETMAQDWLADQGASYPVKLELTRDYFPTKAYGDMVFPCGTYDAVRITIGSGKGHNWWCVLYPPICVPAAADIEDLAQLESDPVASGNPQYEPRFKILEILEGLKKNRELSA